MWVVAGVLLGLVIFFAALGFHTGPHSHVAAGTVGAIAAIWLIVMASTGRSSSVLWTLFGADLAVSVGAATLAWKGYVGRRTMPASHSSYRVEGKMGQALSALNPNGIVRVNGEQWSAVSMNGPVAAGASVQVIGVRGVRVEVWGEPEGLDELEWKG